jgi:NAD(P)-dependent dehydrogenase (short-subunit alcohol dehydrogenase family)
MAKALAVNGASKVYILGRRMDVLESAAKEQKGLIPVQCDVTSKASLQSAVDRVTAEAGFVNLLIANSGVLGPPLRWDPSKSVSDLRHAMFGVDNAPSIEDMSNAFHVNVSGATFTLLAFLELLEAGNKNALKGGFGAPAKDKAQSVPSVQSQVVFTSSIAAFSRHPISTPAYAGSKAAIMHLTKQAATAMATYGIRANALAPGREYTFLRSTLVSELTSCYSLPVRTCGGFDR